MVARSGCYLAFAAAVSLAGSLAGQAPAPDLRALSLRSLQAGRTIRISGREIGTLTGAVAGVRDGALWLGAEPAARSVPLAGIDSVWVSRGHGGTGALIGTLVGAVVAVAVMSGKTCELGDWGCIASGSAEVTGIMLSGTLLGVAIGSGAKSWQLRYP
jgi:hypothetical protein